MIDLSKVQNYYVACGYTDLRRGIGQTPAIGVVSPFTQKVEHLRKSEGNQKVVGGVRVAGDRRKFCVIDVPRQYENLRLSQE